MMHRLLIFLLVVAIFGTPPHVNALSSEQKRTLDSNALYFNVEDGPTGSATCSTGVFSGSENTEIAFNYFRSIGLTDSQSAGIVGNLYAESGVIPTRKQGDGIQTISSPDEIRPELGFGIAQWTSAGRQRAWLEYAEQTNRDPLSLELQLDYLRLELESNPGYGYEQIKQTDDVRQATWIFMAFFERPAVVVDAGLAANETQPTSGAAKEELDHRTSNAQGIITEYGDTYAPSGNTCGINLDTSEPSFAAIPSITIDGSPPGIHRDSNCTGSFTVGANSLGDFVLDQWSPPVTSVQGYNCRSIVGSDGTSIHGLGRAIDIMIDGTTEEGLNTGNEIRNVLINNAEALGVQRVIWNRGIWSADKDGWREYTGESPHVDHLHVEINLEASTNENLAGGV